MDFQKILLYSALALTLLMLYQAWQEDYGKPLEPVAQVQQGGAEDVPGIELATQNGELAADSPQAMVKSGLKKSERIHVSTDLFDIEIDTTGGDIRKLNLLKYSVSLDEPDKFVELLSEDETDFFVVQSGLMTQVGEAPDHHTVYQTRQTRYTMDEGKDELNVDLIWTSSSGIEFTKRYTFQRDSYVIKADMMINNHSGEKWSGFYYRQLQRGQPETEGSMFMPTYTGGVIYSEEEKYEKIDFSDIADKDLKRTVVGGWQAMIEHYFLGAWIPDQQEKNNFYSKYVKDTDKYVLGMYGPQLSVASGESLTSESRLYLGPKIQSQMEEVVTGLELTVDYGILTIISDFLFWILEFIHNNIIANWGWSIILLTVLIKAVFYKLSETSYRSMAHMRKMQPKLTALKERYGDDKQGMSQAMMDMYRKEKINPLGGCLPILVQIPVFIALYYVLLESVEMRQAPFMLWIHDLSVSDPYYVLPLLMGLTMFIQHKLNPAMMDPMQQRVMMIMPIAMTAFFLMFPAGLVLYWLVNNTLSIMQQYYITRIVLKD